MPELCRFAGLIIRMYYDDTAQHKQPHIHIIYEDSEAVFSLEGKKLGGKLPAKKETLIKAWIELRKLELYKAWDRAVQNKEPGKLKPLT
jgi:hypothetical protein